MIRKFLAPHIVADCRPLLTCRPLPIYRLRTCPLQICPLLIALAAARCCSGAPTIDQSHIISQSVGGLITVAEFTPAQTFTVGKTGLLSKIDVQIGRDSDATDDLALEIWSTTAGVPSGAGPLFSTPILATAIPVQGPGTGLPFTSVDVKAANLNVAAGSVYAIAVRGTPDFDEPNAFWNWGSPGYAGGNPYATAFGNPWDVESETYDFGFRTWVDSSPSLTQTLELTPIFDAAADYVDGSGFVISDGAQSIPVRRVSFNGTDQRALMEFDLSAIPGNATIESATFQFDINQRSEGPGEYPMVELYGFAGDGVLQPADADHITDLLGTTPEIDSFDRLEVALDAATIRDLRFASDFLGVVGYQRISPHAVNMVASELAIQTPSEFIAPTLSITYSVPPSSPSRPGDYNGNGFADAGDYTVWRDSLGQAGDSLPADGDDDDAVDPDDYLIWKNAFAAQPPPGVRNGDFASGDLSQWEVVVDPNTNVSVGFPRVESFDVDGDGIANSAMRIRLARTNASLDEGGRAGLDQEILVTSSGDYILSTDFAAASFQDFGNTAPGRFELLFDDEIVDFVDLNGTVINGFEVIRGDLEALLTGVETGFHKLSLRVHRPGTNSREIYEYFDNVTLTLVSPLDTAAVPEPSSVLVGMLTGGVLGALSRRRSIHEPLPNSPAAKEFTSSLPAK